MTPFMQDYGDKDGRKQKKGNDTLLVSEPKRILMHLTATDVLVVIAKCLLLEHLSHSVDVRPAGAIPCLAMKVVRDDFREAIAHHALLDRWIVGSIDTDQNLSLDGRLVRLWLTWKHLECACRFLMRDVGG